MSIVKYCPTPRYESDLPLLLLRLIVFSWLRLAVDRPERPDTAGSSVDSSGVSSYSWNDMVCCIEAKSTLGFTTADEAELEGQEFDMSGDSDPKR